MQRTTWSTSLQETTKEVLYECPVSAFYNGNVCHLKHLDGRYGTIDLYECLAMNWRITVRDTGVVIPFETLDDLVADGWVVD
jgi:hypothetical protein